MICKYCAKLVTGNYCLCCGTQDDSAAKKRAARAALDAATATDVLDAGDGVSSESSGIDLLQQDLIKQEEANKQVQYGTDLEKHKQMSRGSLMCAIMGLFIPLGAIIGIFYSIICIVRSKNFNGEGKGLAIAGLVVSIIVTVAYIVFMVLLLTGKLDGILDSIPFASLYKFN